MADIAMFDFVNLFRNPGTSGKPDIPSTANLLMFAGYHAYGDAPVATYIRIASSPSNASNPACIQDKLNDWWGLQPTGDHVDVRWFGAKVDDITDDGPDDVKVAEFPPFPSWHRQSPALYEAAKRLGHPGPFQVDHPIDPRGG
jgi:hypothetical protein